MKYYLLFIILVIVSSCEEETEDRPTLPKDYGSGLYIATSNGVSFYDGTTVKNQIFNEVNGITLNNIECIKFKGSKAYILSDNTLYLANIQTFENKGSVGSFINAVDFVFVGPDDRMFVVDKDDSKVKVVDLQKLEITSDIETGDVTSPVSIVGSNYRSIVMNGGGITGSLKDSTIVAIDYRDELEPLAEMNGSLHIGDNPNSAVNINNNLKVLCKGIYDPNDLANKTQSALVTVNPWDMIILGSTDLQSVYNANNLLSNDDDTEYYFTAEGGFYKMNANGTGISLIRPLVSDILYYQDESYSEYSVIDSVTYYYNRDVLYVNNSENSKNIIYKFNLDTDAYIDTIIVDGNVKDINFY